MKTNPQGPWGGSKYEDYPLSVNLNFVPNFQF